LKSEELTYVLNFDGRRLAGIEQVHDNISEAVLAKSMAHLSETFDFVTNRVARSSSWTSWKYEPTNGWAFAHINFYKKPTDKLFGFPQCSYKVLIRDGSWTLLDH